MISDPIVMFDKKCSQSGVLFTCIFQARLITIDMEAVQ